MLQSRLEVGSAHTLWRRMGVRTGFMGCTPGLPPRSEEPHISISHWRPISHVASHR